jgi:protein gp37
MSTNIEWTNETWNPLTGCTLVSEGCRNCYAAREAAGRLSHHPAYAGLAVRRGGRPVFTGEVRLHPERLEQPLRWKRPRMIFVNSMSDLFHESVPFGFVDKVFAVMALTPRHTYQILTKRPERMREYLTTRTPHDVASEPFATIDVAGGDPARWPLPNVWLGTSVEDQASADRRIPHLLETPAAVRFLSCEPLLGPVDLGHYLCKTWRKGVTIGRYLDWAIVGGESGPNARPMHPDWARSLRDQCQAVGVPFFFKQWGEWAPVNRTSQASGDIILDPRNGKSRNVAYPSIIDAVMRRVGKRAAGRELDGRTWDEMPAVAGTLAQEEA